MSGAMKQHRPNHEPSLERPSIVDDLQQLINDGHKFRTVMADPPWRYDNRASRGAAENHYQTLSPGPFLELYGREELPNTDWTVYGNQVEIALPPTTSGQ